jgi:pentatricopeptide repeat protein
MFHQSFFSGYIHNNLPNKAIELFHEIKNPDEVIILTFFNACAELKNNEALDLIKKISSKIPKTFYSNSRLVTSLFDALIKCEDCSTAEILFSKMKKSIISYGNLMNGFNKENNPEKTLNLFYQMKIDDIEPNLAIYLCVIKALSQLGVFPVSQSIVQQIPNSFLFDHKIQNTLIDMWVRSKTFYPHFFLLNFDVRAKLDMSMKQNKFLKKCLNQIKSHTRL